MECAGAVARFHCTDSFACLNASPPLANTLRQIRAGLILSPFEWTIAKRYLLPGRSEAFIALVAGISITVVMLSVAMLVIVMSVMNGFRAELLDKIVGLNGHAIGTARAFEISHTAGAFASLGMGLTGVFTALILPLFFRL